MQTKTQGLIPQVKESTEGRVVQISNGRKSYDSYRRIYDVAQQLRALSGDSPQATADELYLHGIFLCAKTRDQLIQDMVKGGCYV
jgi:hypothetical protein